MPNYISVATAAGAAVNDGVQLNNVVIDVYSREIWFEAQPILRFEQIATPKTELGVMPGLTINFLRYNNLSGSYKLTENVPMQTHNLSTSQVSITVGERGYATKVTELLLQSAFTDVMADTSQLLGQHFAKSRDSEVRDALLTSPNVLYSNAKSGRTTLTSADTFNVELIREAVERLATNKAPKYAGEAYICLIHPRQGRYLRKDPSWVNASNYGAPGQIFNGEIGRIEDVRFIETTMIPYISKTDGSMYADSEAMLDDNNSQIVAGSYSTNADVFQAVIVGDHCVGLAISQEVELRDDGVKDFGRNHALGYYGIWGCGLINPKHVFVLETA